MTVAVLLFVVLVALKGKEEFPVFPNAGEDAAEVLLLVLFEKVKADAVELGPPEKAKLFVAVVDAVLLLLVLPIPPKENGLFAVGAEAVAAEFVGADTAGDVPNENGVERVVVLD